MPADLTIILIFIHHVLYLAVLGDTGTKREIWRTWESHETLCPAHACWSCRLTIWRSFWYYTVQGAHGICFLVLQEVLICYQRERNRKEIREKVTSRGREKEACLCCACDLQRLMHLCCVLTHGCLIFSCALSPVFRGDTASKLLWQAAKVRPLISFIVKNKATESCGNGNLQMWMRSSVAYCRADGQQWLPVVCVCVSLRKRVQESKRLQLKCYASQKYTSCIAGASLWVWDWSNQSVSQ